MVLPDAHADFIFAVAGEEFGLVVCLLLVALLRLRRAARLLAHGAASTTCSCCWPSTGLLTSSACRRSINMASSLHLMPTKGMTLPFISYGGSSLLALALRHGHAAGADPQALRRGERAMHDAPAPHPCLAAGGTGGHMFPAEALARELLARGLRVALVDRRARRRLRRPPAGGRGRIASRAGGVAGSGLDRAGCAAWSRLGLGVLQARRLLRRLEPAVVVGFGGYPSVPTVLAAAQRGACRPLLHEQNAVLGRANRLLARAPRDRWH